MREIVQPAFQAGSIHEQGRGLGAHHFAVAEQIDLDIVLAARHACRYRHAGAKQRLTEKVDAAGIFDIKAGALVIADRRLAETLPGSASTR